VAHQLTSRDLRAVLRVTGTSSSFSLAHIWRTAELFDEKLLFLRERHYRLPLVNALVISLARAGPSVPVSSCPQNASVPAQRLSFAAQDADLRKVPQIAFPSSLLLFQSHCPSS